MNDLRQAVSLDLRYSEWASRTLLSACSELPVADRTLDLSLSHASVLGTLHHAFVSERFWTECLLAKKSRRSSRSPRRQLRQTSALKI
jgi:uncharacterized damage-inducible protein DinB